MHLIGCYRENGIQSHKVLGYLQPFTIITKNKILHCIIELIQNPKKYLRYYFYLANSTDLSLQRYFCSYW